MKITPGVTWASGDTVNHTQLNAFLTNAEITSGTLDQVALGENALDSLTSGTDNVGIGDNAGTALTSGHSNVAVGNDALKTIPEGYSNVAIGEGAMSLGAGSPTYNVAIGQQALEDLSGAVSPDAQSTSNVAIGHNVGKEITTGASNTLVGVKAGEDLTTDSSQNVAIGGGALSDSSNAVDGATAVGYEALKVNSANISTALGYKAGYANTSGGDNTYLGAHAGYTQATGSHNVLVGDNAGYYVASGSNNVMVGAGSGDALTTDSTGNVLLGVDAMGGSSNAVDYCTAAGFEALKVNEADNNVGVGYRAGVANTSGADNTYVGNGAGYTNASGSDNTFVGDSAGYGQTGIQCTSIGASSGGTGSTSYGNSTCLGYGAVPTASNQVVIGNTSVTDLRCEDTGITTISSDERIKEEVAANKLGLKFIDALRTVSYKKINPFDWPDEIKEERFSGENAAPKPEDDKETHHGMIAQEVKAVMDKQKITNWRGWKIDPNGKQNLAYGAFIIPLIKAVQELSAKVAKLEAG